MKAILACVDLSDATPHVVETAVSLASAFGVPLQLVHVGEPEPDFVGYRPGPETVREQVAHELRDEHRKLHELAEVCRGRGLEVTSAMVRGPFAESILEQAGRAGAGMIVLGSHGHGPLHALLVGSVTAAVLKSATVPVVVVPARSGAASGK